jgi:hypothetical protein
MRFQAALIKEQGVTFAVVAVKSHVLSSSSQADDLIRDFQKQAFPGTPVVLAAEIGSTVKYYGRPDIVRFLRNYPLSALPWRWYTLN